MRSGKERDLLTEARYWLAETYYRLDRFQQADALFRQVARGPKTADFSVWSLHSSGWTALRLNDMSRARDTFAQFQAANPPELEAWARHGLGLANYALGRHDEAVAAWTALASRAGLAGADVSFWLGKRSGASGSTIGRSARSPSSCKADRTRCSNRAGRAWAGGAWRPSAIRRASRHFARTSRRRGATARSDRGSRRASRWRSSRPTPMPPGECCAASKASARRWSCRSRSG